MKTMDLLKSIYQMPNIDKYDGKCKNTGPFPHGPCEYLFCAREQTNFFVLFVSTLARYFVSPFYWKKERLREVK